MGIGGVVWYDGSEGVVWYWWGLVGRCPVEPQRHRAGGVGCGYAGWSAWRGVLCSMQAGWLGEGAALPQHQRVVRHGGIRLMHGFGGTGLCWTRLRHPQHPLIKGCGMVG